MRAKQRSSQCRVPRASLLLTLTTIILFSCSQQSLAQQRDENATNADSNTSNTAPNRSAVNFNFNFANLTLLNGEFLEAFGANNSRGILRGHPTIAGIELGSLSADPLMFSTNSTERMRILANGFVGIGTTNPNTPFELHFPDANPYSSTVSASASRLRIVNSNTTNNNAAELNFSTVDTSGAVTTGVRVVGIFTNHTAGVGAADLSFVLRNAGNWSEVARFASNGNVGIGTDSPGARLDISGGNLRVQSGTLDLNNQIRDDSINLFNGWYTLGIRHGTFYAKSNQAFRFESMLGNSAFNAYEIGSTAGATFFAVKNDGKVGVGTIAPAFKFDVQGGQVNASGGLCIAGDCKTSWAQVGSQWTTAGTSIFYNTGNVGIGTSAPGAKLQVLGVAPGGTAAFSGTGVTSHFNYNGDNTEDTYIRGGKSSSRVVINDVNSGNVVVALGGGNVGLGTGTPVRRLDLFSDVAGISFEAGTGSPNSGVIRFGDGSGWKLHFGRSRNGIGAALNSGTAGVLMTIHDNGNVGIGTTAPGFKLDVIGEINATGFRINGTPISTGAVSSVFGRTGAVVAQAGDYTWAQINKSTSSLADIATRNAGDLSSGTLPDARFPTTLPAVSGANLTALNASNLVNGTVPIARLGSGTADANKFLRGDNTWAVPSGSSQWTTSGTIISYNSGNVGIGTATPTEKLEVIGDIKVSGNINAKYQDVAEWVDSSQELVAGTVVVLDSSKSNQVIASTQSYDSRVAGVISRQPGLTLGEAGEGRVLVATTGRLKVKVDATNGAIQIGDLLVTSYREGFAMKSLPVELGGVRIHRPGTLIGKALEPLAKGTGEILVLLSLQ